MIQNNSNSKFDTEEVKHILKLLYKKGDVVELRILNTPTGAISGYFDNPQDLISEAAKYSGKVPAVYVTLNPIKKDLLARAHNRVKHYAKATTSDSDIIKRRWLPIDVDPIRPKGISSTSEEHQHALDKAKEIRIFLKDKGWPEPAIADSGNGAHLLYRIDLPNDEGSRDLLRRCLEALDFLFSDERICVDRSVHNAARIWKLYGTMSCKGDNIPERPHRLARLLEVPPKIMVSRDSLQHLAAMLPEAPKPENKLGGSYKPLDIERWTAGYGISIRRTKSWQGGTVYELIECPFNPEHNAGEARIIQFPNGALSFGCFHNSCQGYDWHALRDKLEPGWREKQNGNGFNESTETDSDYLSQEIEPVEKQSQADRLVSLVEQSAVALFHDEYGDPYARLRVDRHFEICKVKSKSFKRWLSRQFWNTGKKVPNTDALNSALNVIEAKACFEGNKHQLHNRVAWHDGAIWYDLGNWKAVKITKEGWEIVEEPHILFRRYSHQKEQVAPQKADPNDIGKIFDFVNITREELQLLYVINLVCSLIPDIPHPIDVLHGDQGTAKTTASKVKKELVDPSETKTLTFPSTMTEFVQQASHHWFIPLDNLRGLPDWLSDALCRTVTGEGFSKRELYTDDEDIIYRFRRCVGLNGINLVPTKPDLLDRSLIFELDPIPPEKKKNEVELWNEFEGAKPKILGALFSLISKAMREYGNVKLTYKPRMADFATWGCAVARALGKEDKDFITAYFNNIKVQNEEAIEASPIARVIMTFMDNKTVWEGSPSELLEGLNNIAAGLKLDKDKHYPKDTRWLWRRIKEVRTNLQAEGILVDRDDSDHKAGRKILLKWIPNMERQNTAQQDRKNDVPVDMMSESEQTQVLRTDNNKRNDVPDNVHPNHAEPFDSGQGDNRDNISETPLEDEDFESWAGAVREFLDDTGGS